MSYQDTEQQLPNFSGRDAKAEERDDESPEPEAGQQDKKSVKHRRNYQACEPCRERKVKCDLGDVDNPSKGPCKKCARESKDCWFRETRKKDSNKDGGRAVKRPRTDSSHSARTIPTLPPRSPHGGNGFTFQSNSLSPTRPFPPTTPPGALPAHHNVGSFSSQPRSTPTQFSRPNSTFAAQQHTIGHTYGNGTAGAPRTANGDDHVVMPQANSLLESFTNTTDNMSVLVRAATTTESGVNSAEQRQRHRALTGSAGDIDLRSLTPQAARVRQQARQVWSQMRFVRAGWFTADEALQLVDYFYTHLAPMTPVVIQDFSDPSTHRRLLSEEPVLALAILAITSRYYELKTIAKVSRGYYIHEKLWDSLRKIVQRLLWGQEQFGGGFTGAGMVPTQQSATGQITWKGSLRTLGTIEALLLLTDWQPRALHFPPGDDENKLVGAGFALLEDEKPRTMDSGNIPYSTWLEPAWRSDRMSWMLLGLAQSLAFELGVFDTRHEHCGGQHGPESDCMRSRRIRRLVITYVSQISGRIGIQASLTPKQDDDPKGPNAWTPVDMMQNLWFDIASVMFDANREIFPSRETTAALIDSGEYKAAIARFKPRLEQWYQNFLRAQDHLKPAMRPVLRMEYEYSRLYVNSLGLQKVVGQIAQQDRSTTSRGLVAQLGPVYDDNKEYIDEVRDAAKLILESSCFGLGDLKALGCSPVRTFLRTLSGLMFCLKLFSLGNEERVVRATFKLLREMTKRMSEQVVDDVHLSPHTARLILQLMEDVNSSMVRIPKPGSRGQTRDASPQPPQPHSSSMAYSAISDQESPDPLGQIPFADYQNQTFMMPSNFDVSATFDTNIAFDSNVDPALFPSGEDWISLPVDNLLSLDSSTVNQGYGGIGPTFGDRDMLSILTGTQLDQNQGSGLPTNFLAFGNGF